MMLKHLWHSVNKITDKLIWKGGAILNLNKQ